METDKTKTVSEKKWFTTDWGIILLLVVFFPIGLYLMWKYSKWSTVSKIVITIIIVLFVFMPHDKKTETEVTTENVIKTEELSTKKEPIFEENVASKEAETQTNEEKIKAIVQNQLGNDVIDTWVKDMDGYVVDIRYKLQDNFSNKDIVKGNNIRIAKIMVDLINSNLPIEIVTFYADSTLVDKYGNESEGTAIQVTFNTETIKKINWQQSTTMLANDIIPGVAYYKGIEDFSIYFK